MENGLKLPDKWPEDFTYTDESGLTQAQAEERMREGRGNVMDTDQGKSLKRILFDNIFTFFNFLNFALAACLLLVGSYRNMLFILVIIANILIGTVQEYRAQKTIRRLQLLNAPDVHVLRGGQEVVLKPEETVQGDLAVFRAGDQIVADAVIVNGAGAAMESLLTGESDPVPKQVNSWLYSGSYVVEGRMTAQLVYVANDSYLGRLNKEAKKTSRPGSRLMEELNRLIRFDTMVLVPLGLLLFLKQFIVNQWMSENPLPFIDLAKKAVPESVAAMIGMIPEGLILLTSIAMAVGVIKLGRKKALVQELAGIETLARADVLCLDKTGTITSGDMELTLVQGVDRTDDEAEHAFSRFLGVFDEKSPTLCALRSRITPGTEAPRAVLPFSSERKKSAATFADGTALIFGAPEYVLGDACPAPLRARIEELANEGRRVLVLAGAHGLVSAESLPPVEEIIGMVALTDRIRPGAQQTLRYFREQGVELKVISGDNPRTVSRIAKQAGLEGWDRVVDARQLDTPEAVADACDKYTVFGRVSPEQKKTLVLALKEKGHNVAMTGDGVNDIPALKAADCSIAMAGGADAARHAAQLTLLDSDFSVMPDIVLEGRRVINNITRAASLFLTKTLFSFFLSILTLLLPAAYPFHPIHLTLISALTVGIPGFFLALEPCEERIRGDFLRTVLMRALPGGIAVTLCAALAMNMASFGWDRELCSTVATIAAWFVGFLVLLRTCLPLNRNRAVLLAAMAAAFAAVVLIAGHQFELVPLTGRAWPLLLALCALGCAIVLGTAAFLRGKQKDA